MPAARTRGRYVIPRSIWSDDALWSVRVGQLRRRPGRPQRVGPLFEVVGEKLPFECLDDVRRTMREHELPTTGVYVAHDSMGYARYIGRGDIFNRLRRRKYAQQA